MSKFIPDRFRQSIKYLKWVFLAAILMIPAAGVTGTQLENHDDFCGSCHTEPEAEYVARTHAGTAVDLASFHTGEGVNCIDCHSGEGTNGRIQALTLGAHDLLKFVSGSYPQPAPLTHAIDDVNCTKCHSDVFQNRNFNNHFHFFLTDWQSLSSDAATCTECHQTHTTDGNTDLSFLSEDHTASVCQRCHAFNRVR
ncbi:MAG: NapC/NirT family cytochrome c [Candidatus Promineifilaceae bacterium]